MLSAVNCRYLRLINIELNSANYSNKLVQDKQYSLSL